MFNLWLKFVGSYYRIFFSRDLLHEPYSLTPCNHTFCENCLRGLSSARIIKCPICRQCIENSNFESGLARQIKDRYPQEYEDRRSYLVQNYLHLYDFPLPPIRRTPMEIVEEWYAWIIDSELLGVFLILTFVMLQFIIAALVHLLFHGSILARE